MATAHGGQLLVSATAAALLTGGWSGAFTLTDLGEHRWEDLALPERVFQAAGSGLLAAFRPIRSLTTVRGNLPVVLTSFQRPR